MSRERPARIAAGRRRSVGPGRTWSPRSPFHRLASLPGLVGLRRSCALFDHADAARPLRSAFWRGWLAGAAFFGVSTWWVGEAFFVDAADQGWMAPFAVTFMAAVLALFWGGGGRRSIGVARAQGRGAGFGVRRRVISASEWLRGHVLTGFPWDLPGESWPPARRPPRRQPSSAPMA